METSVLILMRIVSRLTPQIRKKNNAISASGRRMYRVQEMAKHIQLKLPSFRVTVRPTSGPVQKKIIHRSATSQVSQKLDSIEPGSASSPKPLESDYQHCDAEPHEDDDFTEGSSLHRIQKKANASAWEKIRPSLLKAVVESEAMPPYQECIKCFKVPASLRCRKCGPYAFFCTTCFLTAHCAVNIFHVAEEWKVSQQHLYHSSYELLNIFYLYCMDLGSLVPYHKHWTWVL